MYVILIPAKIVEHVFQQIRPMTANVLWGGPGHTVKVSGTFDDNGLTSIKTIRVTLHQ